MINALYIFDFDMTLFRSPMPPGNYQGRWWSIKTSLEPPCVPLVPNDSWWTPQVVSQFRKYTLDENSYVLILTGREPYFRPRIEFLLNTQNLKPDELVLVGRPSLQGKIEVIDEILNECPSINYIELWDDRLDQLSSLHQYLKKRGITIFSNPIVGQTLPAQCSASEVRRQSYGRY